MEGLRIALPGGALLSGACELLTEAGITDIDASAFDERLLVHRDALHLVKVRPTDVPVYVEMGACDCGIVGKDILWEIDHSSYELIDLRFGGCRLVLAAPEGSAMARGEVVHHLRIATKYPRASRRFFDGKGMTVELLKLHGSIELAPATGLVDAVIDLTMTGRTLLANQLVEVAEAGTSTARLIVNQASLKTRSTLVNGVATALREAVESAASGGRPL
ncbi:MAG: ATP phosphoribosyltransferase [Candidatus Dormibacteria bacterium]